MFVKISPDYDTNKTKSNGKKRSTKNRNSYTAVVLPFRNAALFIFYGRISRFPFTYTPCTVYTERSLPYEEKELFVYFETFIKH